MDELVWHPLSAVTRLRYSKTSELVAFSCDDLSIRVIDLQTRKLVREFWGCVGQVNDFIFSNDGRWIIAASMDSVIRAWDLPTGHLIDIFRVPTTCISLSMSSTGEFLATAHAGSIGINLWSNRSLFMPVSTKNLDEDAIGDTEISAPSEPDDSGLVEAAFLDTPEPDETEGPVMTADQLREDMVTLSLVPRNRWQTLLHIDSIRVCNADLIRFTDLVLSQYLVSYIYLRCHRNATSPRRFPKHPRRHHSFLLPFSIQTTSR